MCDKDRGREKQQGVVIDLPLHDDHGNAESQQPRRSGHLLPEIDPERAEIAGNPEKGGDEHEQREQGPQDDLQDLPVHAENHDLPEKGYISGQGFIDPVGPEEIEKKVKIRQGEGNEGYQQVAPVKGSVNQQRDPYEKEQERGHRVDHRNDRSQHAGVKNLHVIVGRIVHPVNRMEEPDEKGQCREYRVGAKRMRVAAHQHDEQESGQQVILRRQLMEDENVIQGEGGDQDDGDGKGRTGDGMQRKHVMQHPVDGGDDGGGDRQPLVLPEAGDPERRSDQRQRKVLDKIARPEEFYQHYD